MQRSFSAYFCSVLSLLCLGLAGCTPFQQAGVETATAKPGARYRGTVHGGQQPVVGAAIQLWVFGRGLDGGAPTALLPAPVYTDANGSFDIDPSSYTCPSYGTLTYMTATGGNPGITGVTSNPNIAALAITESCTPLADRYISINEVTTVAGVFFYGQFFGNYPNIGFASTNNQANYDYILDYEAIMDLASGLPPGMRPIAGASFPIAKMYTLANVIATCINSPGGTATDTSTACGKLFSLATPPGGPAPTNTVDALVNLYRNPSLNVPAIFALSTPSSPYQPALTSTPSDWYLRYTTGTPTTPKYNLCTTWGDSLTQGNEDGSTITIATALANLPSCYAGNNQGVGGQTSTAIGIREGGVQTTVTVAGGVIPASDSVAISFPTYSPVDYNGPSVLPVTISGVDGLVYYDYSVYGQRFQRNTPGVAVPSPANTPMTVNVGNYNSGFTVIWAGRNNSGDRAGILSDIAAMVAALPSPKHYVVLSLTNRDSDYEFQGADGYNQIIGTNQALAAAYPNNYLDIRALVVASYDPSNGEDVIDHGHDVPPSTLRAIDFVGTLSTAIDASTCSIQVSDAPQDYVLILEGEKIRVTGETDEQHITSCIRGYGGTTAAAHAQGTAFKGEDYVHLSGTADLIIAQAIDQYIQTH